MVGKKTLFILGSSLIAFFLATAGSSAFNSGDVQRIKNLKRCPNCDLVNAFMPSEDLSEADLKNTNMAGANLRYSKLDKANLTTADLTRANLSNDS